MTDLTRLIDEKLKEVQGVRKMYDMDVDYEQALLALKVCIQALTEVQAHRVRVAGELIVPIADEALAEVRRIVGIQETT